MRKRSAGRANNPWRAAHGTEPVLAQGAVDLRQFLVTFEKPKGTGLQSWTMTERPCLVSQLASWGTNLNFVTASERQQDSQQRPPVFQVQTETRLTASQARITKPLKLRALQAGGRQWPLCLLKSA